MAAPRHAHRLIKFHRSYTVEELAARLGIHANTVHKWRARGLSPTDDRRPMLFQGRTIIAFLNARRLANKRPCNVGESYCMRCRVPQVPASRQVVYRPMGPTWGSLVGACPDCGLEIRRRVRLSEIGTHGAILTITDIQPPQHIGEHKEPYANSDYERDGTTND